uniref:Uncharacterized protein n=1 Tax=Alexandrium catenella TaxID=2925 RepID=A0A7S1PMN0_ALECA
MPELSSDLALQVEAQAPKAAEVLSPTGVSAENPWKAMGLAAGDDVDAWDGVDDEIVPSKKVVILLADSADEARAERDACRPEPEPELQADAEPERGEGLLAAVEQPRTSSVLATIGPNGGMVAPQEAVEEMKLRWQRFSRDSDEASAAAPSRDRLRTGGADVLFEELQAKWREIRGTTAADLRPDFQSLAAPLDVPKVRLGFDSPRRLENGEPPGLLALGDAELGGFDATDAAASLPALLPPPPKAGVTLPPATPRRQWPEPSQSSARTPRKASPAVVSLPAVGLHGRGGQPLAGAAAVAAIHGKEMPRERQQIDDNCAQQ